MLVNQADTALRALETFRDAEHCRALLPNLVVAHWFHRTTPWAVTSLTELLRRAKRLYPHGVGLIQVVSADAELPGTEARTGLAELLREGSGGVVASSVIMPGAGFKVAAARGLVTGLSLLVRPAFPHVVHSNLRESTLWVAQNLNKAYVNVTAVALRAAVESLVTTESALSH